ncbi:TonB family protein [Sulfitobacter guttiformis]|uniref:Outer membrane transport energization protein TonB n=1 Tax=Sulfitobacter guttiformis TaxID=74349 RepID=A0A420DHE6_9RHOB|nr:TonB family protein [Sulfitobacter guttiformis]KIN72630.1 TonB family protein [Sulfitobacter guttiformis KCTC 32187]RKE93639.1 outer membrane transport energization protein TonB [Sulfitobacter guttiformis]
MSLTYATGNSMPLFWLSAVIFSAVLHVGLPAQILSTTPTPKTEDAQPDGITGAMMFDLSDLIAASAALEEDSIAQQESQQAPTVTESPEMVEASKAAEQPILSQIPYDVEDESLKFAVAAPDPEADTEKQAQEIATERDPDQIDVESQVGAEDRKASEQSTAGVQALVEAETTKAASEGLTAEQTEEIRDWQKSIVLLISGAKTYPAKARSNRIEGLVQIRFTLDRYGALIATEVARSSGSTLLDEAAVTTVEQLAKMPAPPNYLTGDEFTLMIPLRYSFR